MLPLFLLILILASAGIIIIGINLSVTLTGGFYYPTTPRDKIVIDAKGATMKSFKAGVADLKVAMLANYVSTGLDQVDAAADALLGLVITEIPDLPTGARGQPMSGYVYESGEQVYFYELKVGMRFFARCKDASNNIAFNSHLKPDITNQGMVDAYVDAAVIDAGTTAVTSTAANGQIVSGSNPHHPVFRSKKLATRTASATESWILVEVIKT